ncbi:MAG: hypothetical protein RIS35_3425 [Pseudomonadota bacterium]
MRRRSGYPPRFQAARPRMRTNSRGDVMPRSHEQCCILQPYRFCKSATIHKPNDFSFVWRQCGWWPRVPARRAVRRRPGRDDPGPARRQPPPGVMIPARSPGDTARSARRAETGLARRREHRGSINDIGRSAPKPDPVRALNPVARKSAPLPWPKPPAPPSAAPASDPRTTDGGRPRSSRRNRSR